MSKRLQGTDQSSGRNLRRAKAYVVSLLKRNKVKTVTKDGKTSDSEVFPERLSISIRKFALIVLWEISLLLRTSDNGFSSQNDYRTSLISQDEPNALVVLINGAPKRQ